MPLSRNDYLLPIATSQEYLLEDTFLQGGYKVVLDMAALELLLEKTQALKVGMLVYVISEKKFFQLTGDQLTKPYWDIQTFIDSGFTRFDAFKVENATWEEADFGGGVLEAVAFPFILDTGVLKLEPSVTIPPNGKPGQVLMPNGNDLLTWVDLPAFGTSRGENSFTSPMALKQGDTTDFSLSMAKTIMLVETTLSIPDIKLEGFSKPARDESNPYTYISHVDYMTDEGVTVKSDGSLVKHRKHSFLTNLETPTTNKIFFRLTNLSQNEVIPVVTFKYLMLEE